jgi:hypothetical protein
VGNPSQFAIGFFELSAALSQLVYQQLDLSFGLRRRRRTAGNVTGCVGGLFPVDTIACSFGHTLDLNLLEFSSMGVNQGCYLESI